jgi:DNA repair protein RadC
MNWLLADLAVGACTAASGSMAAMPDIKALAFDLERYTLTLAEAPGTPDPYHVAGDTFRHREHLKRAGGVWSRFDQAWRFATITHLETLLALLDGRPVAPGLAEAPTTYEPQNGKGAAGGKWGDKHYHGHRERLRNRFMESGPDALADYELIELLLFFSVWRRDTKPLAKQLLERFGGIGGLLAAEAERYRDVKELTSGGEEDLKFTAVLLKAVQAVMQRALKEQITDRPVIGSWASLIDYLQLVMTHEPAEHFRILFLDRKNILIKDEVQSRGTVDHTPLYPREVVKRALELAASAIIMVHNHPSGDPTPSKPDIEMTRQVVAGLAAVSITVHDHVIVGKNRHTSFKSVGLI